LATKAAKVWKYQLLATRGSAGDFVVLSSREFEASDLAAAKSFLAGAVTNVKSHGSALPNAIRLIDPDGEEIWRALIAGPRRAVRRPLHTRDHALLLACRKRRRY
jgi:hypothetical protein